MYAHLVLLYRSPAGLTLYAVSSDGTPACFIFNWDELDGIAPQGAQKEYLRKFEFDPLPPHVYFQSLRLFSFDVYFQSFHV